MKLSGSNLAAFFAPRFPFYGRSGRGDAARYRARVASSLLTRSDTAHHHLAVIGRFVQRTKRRRAMANLTLAHLTQDEALQLCEQTHEIQSLVNVVENALRYHSVDEIRAINFSSEIRTLALILRKLDELDSEITNLIQLLNRDCL